MLIPIDEVVHFDVTTHHPSTGAVTDADSTPTYSVFEEDTDTAILSAQNFTKRTSLTGNYRGSFTASAANGFEAGKWYNVIASATVNSIAAKHVAMRFRVAPAESQAGVPKVDLAYWLGTAPLALSSQLVQVSVGAMQAAVITAASIASDAITAAKIQDAALTAAKFASGAFDAVWSVTTRLLTAGTNIVLAKGTGVTGFNDLSAAQVNTEADTALADAGVTTTRTGYLDNLSAGAVAQASALATLAGKFAGITLLAEWLGLIAGKQTGNATARTELRATGAGSGTFDETTDSQEALRDRGDAAWTTATGFSTLDAAGVRAAVGLASANLDTQLDALPTTAEVNAEVDTALADIHLDHLLAATYDPASKPGAADALLNELVENDGGVARYTANALEQAPTGGSAPTVDEIADEVETRTIAGVTTVGTVNALAANSVNASALAADAVTEIQSGLATAAELAKVPKSDSNVTWNATAAAQLQSEAADALAAYDPPTRTEATADKDEILTAVGDVPTNAELATALAAADDAVLAAIAALNNLSAAQVNAQVVDALAVDTYAEPSAPPAATATLAAKIGWLAILARNTITQTATQQKVRNDANSADVGTASVSDDGTTFTRGEYA